MRRVIAERLTIAKQTIPHFYLSIDCELDAVLAARQRLNAMAPKDGPHAFKLSVNDFLIKALAMALQKVPRANAAWTDAGLLLHRASDIAVAVALDGGGLFTPVVRNAELKSLSEISNEMKDLAARARSKRLAPHEYQGGSTTISNLGMYGIDRFDAVINPPRPAFSPSAEGEAAGDQGRCRQDRDHDERDPLRRSSGHRRRARRRAARGVQGLHRSPRHHAGVMAQLPNFRPATKADAAALAVLVDIAGEGLPAYLWSTLRAPGQSLLEVGRERAGREEGGFSYRNAIIAELDGEIAAALVGYRLDDPYELGDLDALPELVRPLVELEALAPGPGTSTCSPPSPSFAAGALPASC